MRDWRVEIRRHLAAAQLAAAQEEEIAEELGQHLEDRYQELVRGGVSEEEAARTVLAELHDDNLGRTLREVKSRAHDAVPMGGGAGDGWLSGVSQDLKYAFRTLRLSPAFTTAAVLALGLGVGLAALFDRHSDAFDAIEPDLTIQGLSLLYGKVSGTK